jgi:hypothetical protein
VLNTIILTLKFGLKSGEAFGGRDLITGGLQYLQLDLKITKMFSGEGEEVEFAKTMYPTGNVEEWMLEIENCTLAKFFQ